MIFEHAETYIGLAAGLATSVLWTGTSLCFTAAARRIGPTLVNAVRLVLAVGMLAVTHRVIYGGWVPPVNGRQVLYLAMSGVVGLGIGDQALFMAFLHIGPRIAMLVMTTSPLFAAFFGWIVLGEKLHGLAWAGVLAAVAGVAWVVAERGPAPLVIQTQHRWRGAALALVGAACQAGGLLLSKQGMGHGWLPVADHLDPQSATLVRMVFAGAVVVPAAAIRLRLRAAETRSPTQGPASPPGVSRLRQGLTFTAMGAIVGPFLGVWMSLVATDRAPLGVAQTLCSLSPILLLPIAAMFHGERITSRSVSGAVVAVGGVALLFIRPPS